MKLFNLAGDVFLEIIIHLHPSVLTILDPGGFKATEIKAMTKFLPLDVLRQSGYIFIL
jgi:hypothetical protein